MTSVPNDIKKLEDIEKNNDVISTFKYNDTTAWIYLKNVLTVSMYSKEIRIENGNKKDLFSFNGFKCIFKSIKNYFLYISSSSKKSIFLGASTGLFKDNKKILDSYFPYYDLDIKNTIYMLNCSNLHLLQNYDDYMNNNKIVIENYIVGIVKKLFSKIILILLSKKKKKEIENFNKTLQKCSINVSTKVLLSKYCEFIAGYKFYRLFFKYLNIDTAYIVSAPTKSDMVAALKSLNIKTVEIQHGIVGRLHRGYNFNFKQNDILPTVNFINVYNKFWKDEIINAKYFTEKQINIVGRLKYDIVQSDIKELNFKYIIFTGQGAFFNQIIIFFNNADKLLTENNIKMFYKTHPRELESEVHYLKNSFNRLESCEVYNGNSTTEELIKNSLAHVSVFSSCHFDAIYYKNKTYTLDIMENNIMEYYNKRNKDSFIMIDSIENILEKEL
ncbi:MAG: hypothetical protein U9P00_10755 [Pseudomonadota bacterium]|nr:hypothetical protein [Pseudomonadota bacterium]